MNYEALRSNSQIWDTYSAKNEYEYAKLGLKEKNTDHLSQPVASEWLLRSQEPPNYPDRSSFAICLTHDVDDIYFPTSHLVLTAAHYIKKRNLGGVVDALKWRINKRNSPYLEFDKILRIEKTHGVKSTFFFLATDRDPVRFRYKIEDISDIISIISDEGFEIGLHGGYYAYKDPEEIAVEKRRLEKITNVTSLGYRNHYLNFIVPNTWHYIKKAGFSYDSTFGYNEGNGFRNGMCHPYKPFDRNQEKFIDLLEIPLIAMNSAFKSQQSSDIWLELIKLLDAVERCHGVLTVNFHNDVFNSPYKNELLKIYENLLKEGKSRRAWITNAGDIYNWWTKTQ